MNIGVAQRAARGETVCGDRHLIVAGDGFHLVMLCDGAGHGAGAAEVSRRAAEYVEEHASESVKSILEGSGVALGRTRGATMALLRWEPEARRMEFGGVGNVELRAEARSRIAPICAPGVLGRPVRKLLIFAYPLAVGDRLYLFTDGISRQFRPSVARHLGVQAAAERVLEEYGLDYDDATCVVVEPLGVQPRGVGAAG